MNTNNNIRIIGIFILTFLLISSIIPTFYLAEAGKNKEYNGNFFEKGIPYQPFKTLKKLTFVEFDKESYIDDYAYLASIPASVFSDGEHMYCSPLLYFQEDGAYPDEEEYRFLNDYQGTKYLMDDWMSYCNGNLDKLITINVDEKELDSNWIPQNKVSINTNNPFVVAKDIALNEWSYSNDAVVAVIEEDYNKPNYKTLEGKIKGEISGEIGTESFTIDRSYGLAPEYGKFEIDDEYKYVRVDLWYPALSIKSDALNSIPGFGGARIILPSIDPDMQLYCPYEDYKLQTSAAAKMAITKGPHETCFSYVYNPGEWTIGVTNMPTEGGEEEYFIHPLIPGKDDGKVIVYGSTLDAIRNAFGRQVTKYNLDVTKYPGTEYEIEDMPPYGCRDASFKLTWDNENIDLGLTIIGPTGEELESVLVEDSEYQEIHFEQLGECLEGEHYKAVVFALSDVNTPVDFEIEYSWNKNFTKKQGDCIASACEGAVLSSIYNSPLLYVKPSQIPEETTDVLYKLGVEDITIVDIGGYLSEECIEELERVGKIHHYKDYKKIYNKIMDTTGQNDIIFSTIDPWSYWYYTPKARQLLPGGEYEKAFYFGPAAYAAAVHGSPLILVDNHPELTGSIMWHNEFWRKNAHGFEDPPVAPMHLTGTKAYEFLEEYGFDREGVETLLNVAGQYDIGPSWTRVFAGVANPGAIIGTPIDAANHLNRCIFYPGLIYQNPALQGEVELETGSISERAQPTLLNPIKGLIQRLFYKPFGSNLKIIKPSRVEKFEYPVLHTYGCYSYRFNERGGEYWGAKYETREGDIPGESISYEEIDQGTRYMHEGEKGAFQPDLSESEITPFYATKAGYDNAYSMNFDITMDNLNQGVISWYMVMHGVSMEGGQLSWFSPTSIQEGLISKGISPNLAKILQKIIGIPLGLSPYTETNPWRGYDQLWGSTEEPDSATLNSEIGLISGWLGLANPDGLLNGGFLKIGLDVVPSSISLFNFNRDDYHDGLVGPYSITAMMSKFSYKYSAIELDDLLKNLHSMNFHANSCLIGCNYLQIAFMRHGSVLQELDPWGTSYWGAAAFQEKPRDFALGKTAGESYAQGRTKIGLKYVFEDEDEKKWWWDVSQNICLFTDPDLRIWVKNTEYDIKQSNHWELEDVLPMMYDEEFMVHGHTPYGATSYPHAKEKVEWWNEFLIPILIFVLVLICLIAIPIIKRGKK